MAKHVWTKQTNKRTFILRFKTGTQETSVGLHLVKLYKILLRFAVGALVSEICKNYFFFSAYFKLFLILFALSHNNQKVHLVQHAPSSSLLLILNQAVEDSAWAFVPKL